MDLNWTKEAVLAKMGGLPGRHASVLQAKLALHLGMALPDFHRSAVLLLQTFRQAGLGNVYVLEEPGQEKGWDAVLAAIPPGLTLFQRSGFLRDDLVVDMGICVAGKASTAARLANQCAHIPFLWLGCQGPLALLLFLNAGDSQRSLVGTAFFQQAEQLLETLTRSSPAWRTTLCIQFAVFLAISYVSRYFNGTGSFPWLLIDMEQARMCAGEQGLLHGIEQVRLGRKVQMEDFDWMEMVSG